MQQFRGWVIVVVAAFVLAACGGMQAEVPEDMLVLSSVTPSSPTSVGGVVPFIVADAGPGGNVTCEQFGYEFPSARVNYDDEADLFDADFPAGISVDTDGALVSWTSTFGIGAVIVKGGNDANVYAYDPQRTSDSGLASPPNASGNPAGVSNLTFCWDEVQEGQWCSPGYWRQPQHLHAWEATGYAPNDLFFDALGYYPTLSKKGLSMALGLSPSTAFDCPHGWPSVLPTGVQWKSPLVATGIPHARPRVLPG
jgi:hypothetical protein